MYRDLVIGDHLVSVPSKYVYWSRNYDGHLFIHDRPLNEGGTSILMFGESSELVYTSNNPIHTLPPCQIVGGYRYKKFRDIWLFCPDWVDTFDGFAVSSNRDGFPYDEFCRGVLPNNLFITQENLNVDIPPY